MALEIGSRLGHYDVTALIGEGGMGEVYRARDTKLDRDVALKVLPQAFTDDPDRLARFEREAKVLASLNHPQESRPLKWLVVLALLGTIGCRAPEDTSETGGDNREQVLADIPICLQDDYLEDAPRDVAIRDHENHSGSLAPFWPSPHEVVDCMLNLADVEETDVVIDLGSGDGRVVIAAAKRGARGIGIDYDPLRIAQANANTEISGVQDLVTFIEGDIRDADLSEATVVTLYLLSTSNLELLPKLTEELRPGARIVSHDFSMGSWTPDRTVRLRPHTIYLWHHDGTVRPAEEAGANDWMSGTEGKARVGHHDRANWLSAHDSRGCTQDQLRASGGDGLFYCFATN